VKIQSQAHGYTAGVQTLVREKNVHVRPVIHVGCLQRTFQSRVIFLALMHGSVACWSLVEDVLVNYR